MSRYRHPFVRQLPDAGNGSIGHPGDAFRGGVLGQTRRQGFFGPLLAVEMIKGVGRCRGSRPTGCRGRPARRPPDTAVPARTPNRTPAGTAEGPGAWRSPGIMHPVVDDLFLVGLELHAELDGLRVGLDEGVAVVADLPVRPAVEVLDHADFHRFLLVVAQLDLERFVGGVVRSCRS